MIPLKDNLPTERFPILTILLIVINVAVFVWQASLPRDEYSSPELRTLDVPEADETTIELGAIPARVTHPGRECAIGVVTPQAGAPKSEIVCEGSADYRRAAELGERGLPFAPIDAAAWWLTVFTSMFMHGGILHLAGNMLFLWIFGNNIEDSMGRQRFIAFYLLAGIVAVYAQALLDPNGTVPTIGASGAIAGVLGGYAVLHPRARVLTLVFIVFFVTFIEIPALLVLGVWFVLQFLPAVGQLATPEVTGEGGGVAYFAHIGGFVFGMLLIKLFANRERRELAY